VAGPAAEHQCDLRLSRHQNVEAAGRLQALSIHSAIGSSQTLKGNTARGRAAFPSVRGAADRNDSARVPRPAFILTHGRSDERYSISIITIIAIEPTPGLKDACHNRALKDLGHPCLSMRTAGDAVSVEACINLPWPLDTINSPWTGFSILSGQF